MRGDDLRERLNTLPRGRPGDASLGHRRHRPRDAREAWWRASAPRSSGGCGQGEVVGKNLMGFRHRPPCGEACGPAILILLRRRADELKSLLEATNPPRAAHRVQRGMPPAGHERAGGVGSARSGPRDRGRCRSFSHLITRRSPVLSVAGGTPLRPSISGTKELSPSVVRLIQDGRAPSGKLGHRLHGGRRLALFRAAPAPRGGADGYGPRAHAVHRAERRAFAAPRVARRSRGHASPSSAPLLANPPRRCR